MTSSVTTLMSRSLRKVTWYVAALVVVLTLHLFVSLHHMTSSPVVARDASYRAKLTLLFVANGNSSPSNKKDGNGLPEDVEISTSSALHKETKSTSTSRTNSAKSEGHGKG
jgi:hypothetical protein